MAQVVWHSAEDISHELRYDPEPVGEFWWLTPRPKRRLDRQAGCIVTTRSGLVYRVICIDGRRYYAQELAWVLMTGQWPERTVDHIDTNSLNNRWSNLRLATQSEQNMNQTPRRPGLTGASFHKASGLWRADIKKDGKQTTLGYFDTAEKAHEVYRAAAQILFGPFAHESSRQPINNHASRWLADNKIKRRQSQTD